MKARRIKLVCRQIGGNSGDDECTKRFTIFQPKNESTCWFNSLIMSVLFSDGMRNLVKQKQPSDKSSPLSDFLKDMLTKTNDELKTPYYFSNNPKSNVIASLIKLLPQTCKMKILDDGTSFFGSYISPLLNYLGITHEIMFMTHLQTTKCDVFMDPKTKQAPDVLVLFVSSRDVMKRSSQYHYLSTSMNGNCEYKNIKVNDDKRISYMDCNYNIDSAIIESVTKSPHVISGLTCNEKRYIYNGWPSIVIENGKQVMQEQSCPLIKFNWLNNNVGDNEFAVGSKNCEVFSKKELSENQIKNNTLYSIGHPSSEYTIVYFAVKLS